MSHPLRGYAPHFHNSSSLENETKIIQNFTPFEFNEAEIEDESFSVTLNEGDFMYHPAGIWHAVKTESDSISINFSLKSITLADLVTDSLRHVMYSEDML